MIESSANYTQCVLNNAERLYNVHNVGRPRQIKLLNYSPLLNWIPIFHFLFLLCSLKSHSKNSPAGWLVMKFSRFSRFFWKKKNEGTLFSRRNQFLLDVNWNIFTSNMTSFKTLLVESFLILKSFKKFLLLVLVWCALKDKQTSLLS